MTKFQNIADEIPVNMFISIIIPVYNDQEGLNRILESIQSQTMPTNCFEVIVVDNNSEPPMKPCSKISMPYAIYTCSTPGSYAARNYGVKKSRGEILVFIDADCYPSSQWLEAGINDLLKDDNLIIGGEVLFEGSRKPTTIEQYQYITGFGQRENILQKGFTATANLLTTTEVFNSVGKFNETLFSGGDREWCWRAREAECSIQFCSKAIVYTKARKSLREAIIQTRRVTGGRKQLNQLKSLSAKSKQDILPHRGPLQAAKFIFSQNHLTGFDRMKILCVAIFLKCVQILEKIKLFYGAGEERR